MKMTMTVPRKITRALVLALLSAWLVASVYAGQREQEMESRAGEFLTQADKFYMDGDYRKAIENYLQAANLALSRMNLSRAYFGLAVSNFYLRDPVAAKRWLQKVFEVDPKKEISPHFYPDGFAKLFDDAKKESAVASSAGEQRVPATQEPAPAIKPEETKTKKEKPMPSPQSLPPVDFREARGGGYWEVEAHYGTWSLNPVKSMFERPLTKKLGAEIRDEVTDRLSSSHAGLFPSAYEQTLTFNSEGSNYGVEVRFYPRGRAGSMSLGLSFEKTRMRVDVAGSVKQLYSNGSSASVDASTYIETEPFSANISFRWDFVPGGRISPFFVFGLGLGKFSGTFSYDYKGSFEKQGYKESVSDSKVQTLHDLLEEEESHIRLNLFVLVQAALGLKVDIFNGITLKVEAGFWDGLLARGGLAFRF